MMAFREKMKILAGTAANRNIYRDTLDDRKEGRKRYVFGRSCAMPELSDSYG